MAFLECHSDMPSVGIPASLRSLAKSKSRASSFGHSAIARNCAVIFSPVRCLDVLCCDCKQPLSRFPVARGKVWSKFFATNKSWSPGGEPFWESVWVSLARFLQDFQDWAASRTGATETIVVVSKPCVLPLFRRLHLAQQIWRKNKLT